MPEDPAIPVKEIPAEASFTRAFVLDKENLQREQKKGVSGALVAGAYLFVLAVALGLCRRRWPGASPASPGSAAAAARCPPRWT